MSGRRGTLQRCQSRSSVGLTVSATYRPLRITEALPAATTGAKGNRTLPTSERRITRDSDPMHAPTLARVIVERAVLGAAVVPDRQRTNLPAESAGKLWLNGMRHQKIENRLRLGGLETVERLRVIAYVERFAAGLRVGPHKRMRDSVCRSPGSRTLAAIFSLPT